MADATGKDSEKVVLINCLHLPTLWFAKALMESQTDWSKRCKGYEELCRITEGIEKINKEKHG